jgi:hypothetical protein
LVRWLIGLITADYYCSLINSVLVVIIDYSTHSTQGGGASQGLFSTETFRSFSCDWFILEALFEAKRHWHCALPIALLHIHPSPTTNHSTRIAWLLLYMSNRRQLEADTQKEDESEEEVELAER